MSDEQHFTSHDFFYGRWLSKPSSGEEVVISGMSGRFPNSENVEELKEQLYNKTNMFTTTEKRWEYCPESAKFGGLIPNISKFDCGYFGVHPRQAKNMDPPVRVLMEVCVEAIVDAGIHPSELEGTRTGVIAACVWNDIESASLKKIDKPQQFGLTGSIPPNRISYYFKLKGPSYMVDTACSSSLNAINQAFRAIRRGECDNVLVYGCHTTLIPETAMQLFQLGVVAVDGVCKIFDQDADGYVRGEGIVCLFIQKSKNARRNYAQVIHSKVNDVGVNIEGMLAPSSTMQGQLLHDIYEESGLSASELGYFEAHAIGTKAGDFQEVKAIDEYLARKRKEPLWIGSVKSNIGHGEATAGLASTVKVILAMESGYIAPNYYFNKVKSDLTGIVEGRIKIVTEITPLEEGKVVGINNIGFGGNNCHAILRGFSKKKVLSNDNLPRLVCVSGRTNELVLRTLKEIGSKQFDVEYLGLIHHIFKKDFPNHLSRGYAVVAPTGIIASSVRRIKQLHQPTPLYINFGNFDKSYQLVSTCFKSFPVFKLSMMRIRSHLQDEGTFELIESTAVQMAIVDVLRSLQISCVGVYQNDLGEFLCKYLDDSLSLEEILLKITALDTIRSKRCTVSIPKDASTFELSNVNTALTTNPMLTFLTLLGHFYEHGHNPQLHNLYKEVKFPVSRGTPVTSTLMKWKHDIDWSHNSPYRKNVSFICQDIYIQKIDDNYTFLEGHVIEGCNQFPAAGYLYFIWKVFAEERYQSVENVPIVFENCKFIECSSRSKTDNVEFSIYINKKNGYFEILERDALLVTGNVYGADDMTVLERNLQINSYEKDSEHLLNQEDIYQLFRLKGYNYEGLFKSIVGCNFEATKGVIQWNNNWTTFLDSIFQFKILNIDSKLMFMPTSIKKLIIDPRKHYQILAKPLEDQPAGTLRISAQSSLMTCGGVEIKSLEYREVARKKLPEQPVLERHEFVPNEANLTLSESVRVNMQIILEETLETEVKAVEIVDEYSKDQQGYIMTQVKSVLEDMPLVNSDLTISTTKTVEECDVNVGFVHLSSKSNFLLIVGTKIFSRPMFKIKVLEALNRDGFGISREEKDFLIADSSDITIITQHKTQTETLILFRRSQHVSIKNFVEISSETFEWIYKVKKIIEKNERVILYSRNPTDGILGLTNCLRREARGRNIRCLSIIDRDEIFEINDPQWHKQIVKNQAINVYKNSQWGTYRHFPLDEPTEDLVEHAYLSETIRGNLSSLKWIQGSLSRKTLSENLVHVHYSSINFKDIKIASERITPQSQGTPCDAKGFEYSGTDQSGNRVMGIIPGRALSNLVESDRSYFLPVPKTWSLEEAATVPVVYGTLIYALLMRTKLRSGSSILIHLAAGGIGIACLNIALFYKCKIFVTVENQGKKDFIKKHFPRIPDNHIGNSRSILFEQLIKKETKGLGVDYVVTSLREEQLISSAKCLKHGGIFLELGQYDVINNKALDMLLLEKEATYHRIMLDSIIDHGRDIKRQIKTLLQKGIEEGYVKPLPTNVFQSYEVEKAFRFMSSGKHIGKILIKIQDEEGIFNEMKLHKALLKFYCDPNKSYVILGGLGGFGVELADWLVLRGARKLILSSRTGVKTGYQRQRIKTWSSYGASVKISTSDITTSKGCMDLIQEANSFAPIDGIFNLAVVLHDALFDDQTPETFTATLAPKAYATKYFDKITRELCPNLRHFVVFSSMIGTFGNAGQTNYGMANSIMEEICEKRKLEGLPALAIKWGAIGDVGLFAKMQKVDETSTVAGSLPQSISNCLEVMDRFLTQNNTIVESMVVAEKGSKISSIDTIVQTVASALGIKNIAMVNHGITLSELGVDSFMAVKLTQTLDNKFGLSLTVKQIQNLTMLKLKQIESDAGAKGNEPNQKKLATVANSYTELVENVSNSKTDKIIESGNKFIVVI